MNATAEGTNVELGTPGLTIAQGMDAYDAECFWELINMPGWELIQGRLKGFVSEYASGVMNANRENDAGDRYEVGRYDGVNDTITFINALVTYADPGPTS